MASRDDIDERIAAYDASVVRLEAIHAGYLRRRTVYQRFFVALSVGGVACFAFGFLAGVWGTISAGLISIAGWFMYKTRVWELASEIEETRREADKMRCGRA